jgi:hypothetical protein
VGIRSLHGMIRLSVAYLRPQCVSPSLKGLLTLYGHRRDVHTGDADRSFEVENTPLLRTVRNRASEFANLRSEVSNSEHVDRTPHLMCTSQLPENISSRDDVARAQRVKELEPLVEAWEEWIRVWKVRASHTPFIP